LKILPGEDGEQIACELQVVSLNNDPYYEALSYTWGTLVLDKQIVVRGSTFPITANLESALRNLRHASDSRLIWADLICINQKDEAEKSSQVALMGDIYRQASRCLVWLGDFQDQGINDFGAKQTFEIVSLLSKSKHCNELPFFEGGSMLQTYVSGFEGLRVLLLHPWWQRIWTVQEVVLPEQSLVVWGSQSLPFHILTDATKSVVDHRGSCCSVFYATFPEALRATLTTFTNSVGGIKAISDPNVLPTIPLRDLLWRFRYRQAANPSDKVLGLLGMIKQFKLNLRLDLEYAMTPAEIYTEVALEILREDSSFKSLNYGLISLIGHRGESTLLKNLPSWATDWSVAASSKAQYWYNRFRYDWFSCDGSFKMNLTIHKENLSLSLEGVYVDTITSVGKPLLRGVDDEFDAQDLRSSIREWSKLARVIPPEEGFVKTAIGDRDRQKRFVNCRRSIQIRQSDSAKTQDHEERYVAGGTRLAAFWHAMTGGLILYSDGSQPLRRCCPSDYTLLEAFLDGEALTCSLELNLLLQQWLKDQTYFTTKQGYMGTGPGTVEPGDQVWILFGSNVPFVLRDISAQKRPANGRRSEQPEKKSFGKIGDCYVHGIMQGEVFRDTKARSKILSLF
jgi:Heterokaryon incompatibility protein (HET)